MGHFTRTRMPPSLSSFLPLALPSTGATRTLLAALVCLPAFAGVLAGGAPVAAQISGAESPDAILRQLDAQRGNRATATRIGSAAVDNSRAIAALIWKLRVALRQRRALQAQLRRPGRGSAAMYREIAALQRERVRLRRRRPPYEARRRAFNREVQNAERARHAFNRVCIGSMSRSRYNACQIRRNRLLAWKARLGARRRALQSEVNYVNRRFRYIQNRIRSLQRAIAAARNRAPRLRARIANLDRRIASLNGQLRAACGQIVTCRAKAYCRRAPWQGGSPSLPTISGQRC